METDWGTTDHDFFPKKRHNNEQNVFRWSPSQFSAKFRSSQGNFSVEKSCFFSVLSVRKFVFALRCDTYSSDERFKEWSVGRVRREVRGHAPNGWRWLLVPRLEVVVGGLMLGFLLALRGNIYRDCSCCVRCIVYSEYAKFSIAKNTKCICS